MKNINFTKLAPYLAAIAVFILISIIYVSPVIEGKRLRQGDIMNHKGMSKEIADFRTKTGTEPLWTNSMFGGMPAYQISTLYKGNIIEKFDSILTLGLPHPASIIFLYMLGFFFLLLVLDIDPWLCIAGAIAFGFSSYFFIILEAGHNSKAHAIAYMAPVLAGIILTYKGKYLWGGILTAIFLSLQLGCNHLQITYYMMFIILFFLIFEFYQDIMSKKLMHFIKASGLLVAAAILALLPNFTNLVTTYEYSKYTIRGKSELTKEISNQTSGLDKDYATGWSYGIPETMTLMIPNFNGGSSNGSLGTGSEMYKALESNNVPNSREVVKNLPLYWGTQPFTSGPVYAGAIIFFLFVMGLIMVKGKYKWWLLAATVLSILLAWGHNLMFFTDFFMNYVPGYNKFRTVSMTLVIAELTIPLLAIIALNQLLKIKSVDNETTKKFVISVAIVGGLSLLFALLGGGLFDFTSAGDASYKDYPKWFMDALIADRTSIFRMDALRTLLLILLAAASIWFFMKGKLKKQYVIMIVTALILVDMWSVNKRYFNNDNFVRKSEMDIPYTPSNADLQIISNEVRENPALANKLVDMNDFSGLNANTDYRVLNMSVNTFNDASTSYFHKSIGGYHGAKFRRYQEIIDSYLSPGQGKTINTKVLNMLNTKYFIVPDKNREPMVQRNMYALGNAWFVDEYKLVDNADQEIAALKDFEPSKTAVVDKRFGKMLEGYTSGKDSLSKITLLQYTPNDLKYEYNATKDMLAVFSEIYYDKGWNAYIDGKLTPHFRADYVLRGMVVPGGKHSLEFKFEPKSYYTGEKVSLAGSVILLLLLAGMSLYSLKDLFLKKK